MAPLAFKKYAQLLSAGGASVLSGGFLAVEVLDATPLDVQSSIGASGSGWVAKVVLKDLTSLVGTAVPTALTLSVTDPGYTTAGVATTVSRTITGVGHLRRQWPNGNDKMISTDGTDLTLYITLNGEIYAGTTIVSAAIGGTFYPSCVASSAPTRTNLSARTYAEIKPLFTWMTPQNLSETSSSLYVEGSVGHTWARNQQQVACIEYYVTDGTNQSATVRVSATSLSTMQTKGKIAEVWPATLSMSTQTQGGISRVNARVYPWLGDSTAILDLSTDGVAWPTSLPITQLRVFCDRTGAYGGGYAYVDGTGAGSPVASATPATARANPFATIRAAADALRAWNNANKSHDDYGGGFIRVMDNAGADRTQVVASGLENAPGATHLVIEKDPLATGVVTIIFNGFINQFPNLTMFRSLTISGAGSSEYTVLGFNTAREGITYENCVMSGAPGVTFNMWTQLNYYRNITWAGTNTIGLSEKDTALMIGCVQASTGGPSADFQPKVVIGCTMPNFRVQVDGQGGDGDHGRFIYNNHINTVYLNKQTANTLNSGVLVLQTLCESTQIAASMHLFGDGDLTTVLNIVEGYTTGVGERSSRYYNDVVASRTIPNGVIKRGSSSYCIWDNTNQKADNFNGGGIGSVGGWAYLYGVGNNGNVSLFGAVNRSASSAPSNDSADNYLGCAWLPTSEYNLFRTALGFTQANIMDMFTNYTVAPRGAPALGGDYRPLLSATNIINRVPSGVAKLRYDLAGVARLNNGTGAAGAYEAV